jgi:hypothetical protein
LLLSAVYGRGAAAAFDFFLNHLMMLDFASLKDGWFGHVLLKRTRPWVEFVFCGEEVRDGGSLVQRGFLEMLRIPCFFLLLRALTGCPMRDPFRIARAKYS